jgi:hypothetical protein
MGIRVVDLVLSDTASQKNKELTEYIERNLDKIINKAQIKFKFICAKPTDLPNLRSQGIKGLPALVDNKAHYIGVSNIIDQLRKLVKTSKTTATPKSEEEVLTEFFNKELNIKFDQEGKHVATNDDDDDEAKIDYQAKVAREQSRRKIGSNQNPYQDPPEEQRRPSNTLFDDHPPQRRGGGPPQQQPRADNVQQDPVEVVKRMSTGTQDDELLEMMIGKIGPDSAF